MKKIFLLIGLVVFLTPMVVSADPINAHCVVEDKKPIVFDCKQYKRDSRERRSCDYQKSKDISGIYNIYFSFLRANLSY